jgi:Zn-dependent protease with chaperone function
MISFKQYYRRAALALLVLLALFGSVSLPAGAIAQGRAGQQQEPPGHTHDTYTPPPRSSAPLATSAGNIVERAMNAVCTERVSDPLGSVPIDEMQARPSLPLRDPTAVAGLARAERLLPVAKELAATAITKLARENKIEEWRVRAALRRIQGVTRIKPDVDLRDNASVIMIDPRTIYFGTIFLAGLPSDEGMISVLAHEITHIADGRDDNLSALFRLVASRAINLTGLSIGGRRPEELTCDWVGALSARAYIERFPNQEPLLRRLARLVEHNCVDEDDTDEDHLSPRNTMRALFALDTNLATEVLGKESTETRTFR